MTAGSDTRARETDGDSEAEVMEVDLALRPDMSAETGVVDQPPRVIEMKAGNFYFEPKIVEASRGEALTFSFASSSGAHTFVMDELDIKQDLSLAATFTVVAPTTPGRYPYYCDIGPHRTLGMEGVLIVE